MIGSSDGSNTILSNIERTWTSFFELRRTRTCSSIGNQTRTPYFWLRSIEHCLTHHYYFLVQYLYSLVDLKTHNKFKGRTPSSFSTNTFPWQMKQNLVRWLAHKNVVIGRNYLPQIAWHLALLWRNRVRIGYKRNLHLNTARLNTIECILSCKLRWHAKSVVGNMG